MELLRLILEDVDHGVGHLKVVKGFPAPVQLVMGADVVHCTHLPYEVCVIATGQLGLHLRWHFGVRAGG